VTKGVEDLWDRYRASRDATLRNDLVVHYAPLVKFVVGRLLAQVPPHVDAEDLISEGLIGLVQAVERFDPDRGVRFSTFAVPRILGAAKDGLRGWDWVPRAVRDEIRRVEAARAALSASGRSVGEAELAHELGMSVDELRRIEASRMASSVSPLDDVELAVDPRRSEGEAMAAFLTGEGLTPPVSEGIRSLPERDQIVLALYYVEQLSLAEIGRVLDVSESRVSQLKNRAALSLGEVLVGGS
jgi:RNA polymerase sigma factor for flagellar operon FliA